MTRPGRRRGRGVAAVVAAFGLIAGGCAPSPAASASSATAPSSTAAGSTPASSTPAASPAASVAASVSPAAACPPASAASPAVAPGAWWTDRVFYEVFVRSFADSNGDGIGDLRGLTSRLDALNDGDAATTTDLGITGLWLMPIMASPSYHGYDVTDYRAVNPDYGSAADFRALVQAAHARGIAVVVDFPINHTSRLHPWFVASERGDAAKADWYVWRDETPGGQGWHASGSRWYFGIFGPDMPDLNLRNPAVTAEVTDLAGLWLAEMGADGLRLDAAKHLVETSGSTENTPETHAWLRSFDAAVHASRPDALLVGEVWDLSQVSASYVPDDLDMTFDFGLAGATIDSMRAGSASRLSGALADVARVERPDGFASFLTNHDQERVASQLRGDPASLRLAAGLLLTGPGTPFILYGEEIGLPGQKPDERIRTPLPWDASSPAAGFSTATPWEPLADGWRTVNVAAQRGEPGSLLARYRDLVRFRGGHPALRRGSIVPVPSDADAVVATLRADAAETLLVVANLSDEPVSDYALGLGSGPLCGATIARVLLQAAGDAGIGEGRGEGSGGGGAETEGRTPVVTATGGFAGYRPLAELPARSLSVLSLAH